MTLVNLTNHPQTEWSQSQKDWFVARYDLVVDIPFPQIDPGLSTEDIQQIADSFLPSILALQPDDLLVMGESTFMVAMIRLAQAVGLRVIATTSRRNVEILDDGRIIRRFEFVGTREFQPLCNDR